MNIEITARNFTPSEELKNLINEKILHLKKFDLNIDCAKVVLLKESRAEKVELIINSRNKQYITKCYSSIFEKTILKAISNIKAQIKKDTPPELCYNPVPDGKAGNMKIARGCTWCRHKFVCHSDANDGEGLRVFKYSKKLEYLTNVVKLPRVKEVTHEWKKS